ncbi:DNA ligase D [Dyadobacter koreensis]|uniref:DNA ligase D n=1 Tax=Dyadobacter koreensis TaxID=408657 RepID=A0A1H6VE59_9BACT|nr:non-homologous end-joining DNA ligase [Dyadobacter koreensis]SEJ00127.1 DNA ligase D [Dyadobacter koreensis]
MSLTKYKKKRNFKNTPEPEGQNGKENLFRFVVQRHDATRLHYDFRLELDGVLKSWAVPKGPSMNPEDKRLAVEVEDHPVNYIDFFGIIPEGNYGAGTVDVWDHGVYFPVNEDLEKITEKEALKALKKGELKIFLKGKNLEGGFVLVRLKNDEKNWLLIKHKDEFSVESSFDISKIKSLNSFDSKETGAPKAKTETTKPEPDDKGEEHKAKVNKATKSKNKVELTHLEKIYWPDDKITKGELIEYYESVSKYILPYLKNRPLSLKRNPNGIKGQSFFQKDAGDNAPEWVTTAEIHSESNDKMIDYLVCNDKKSLLYIANLGCIEMNPWNSTVDNLDNPDYIVIDIDPSDKNSFDDVIDVALATKEVLDQAGVKGFCKTSGSSGLHVYIPFNKKHTYDEAKEFAHIIASMVNEKLPDITTLERSLSKRKKNQIYVDYLQNRIGQTLASAYSVRPKPGATVSTPLEWGEVKRGLDFHDFTIKNTLERIEKKGDLFKGVLGKGIDLDKAIQKLEVLQHS